MVLTSAAALPIDGRLVIGGGPTEAPERLEKLDPVTCRPLASFFVAGPAEVAAAVEAARRAQPAWAARGLEARLEVLEGVARTLAEHSGDLARLITAETGKPLIESTFEIATAFECFLYVRAAAPRLLADQPLELPQLPFVLKACRLRHIPHGVCALISPWNFPVAIPIGEVLQALVSGNALVLKPSELTPFTGLRLGRLFLEGGLPEGLLNVVTGDGRTGALLVAADIDKVSFTGSFATGVKIASVCAARGIPCTAELGGKDPAIVLEDARLPSAVWGVLWGAVMNAGQGCSATERVYVARSLHERFLSTLAGAARALRLGDGGDPEVEVGPLIAARQLETVRAHVDDALARGARLVAGGRVRDDLGPLFYEPTVLADCDHSMTIMREETFGPVAPCMPFDTDEEALRLANDTPFGLGATVWTQDLARGEALAERIRAGSVWINDTLFSHTAPQAPWGGPGHSGNARTHGPWGIQNYVRPQFIASDGTTGTAKDGWYPYGPRRLAYTRAAVDFLYRPGLTRKLGALPALLLGFLRRPPPVDSGPSP